MVRLLFLLALLARLAWSPACAALDPAQLARLGADDSDEKIAAIAALASADPEAVLPVFKALSEDALFVAGDKLVRLDGETYIDVATGKALAAPPDNAEAVSINNRVRRTLDAALAGLRLFASEREVRLTAAKDVSANASAEILPLLDKALAKEADPQIKQLLVLAQAKASLGSPDAAARLKAVKSLADSADPAVRQLLAAMLDKSSGSYAEPDEAVRIAAVASLTQIERRIAVGENLGRIFTGISLGSILLLAALGLAITYGVMGVINMAHGELLMVGAYTTWVVQGLFRSYAPQWLDAYVLAAIPLAFVVAALVGVAMERLVIRHLYGRPLETLLATWGLSLVLIQAARVIFGPQNQEVANPTWMSGGIELYAGAMLPLNRIAIIGFALFVLLIVWLMMQKTRLGMFVRAVTQNRPMAGCVGVPTRRIDTLAFAIGSGIAGLGGVALSQIANVGPDMGQGYIVDSFLVVVLGGVGQLAGAVWAALGLGIVTKFLEGWAGAVIAKILVLLFIIVFIQKRPQGLFALKGRFVES
ncbi:urea ABC transporter permease subunit UrtB [Niveibacterium sp. COAC-50]|uniref:urea ABC transporter permease subunit UrtB n=1 Tax=Niveibacterium sp. COAC-50 TaxID=2729384 RepID=UPI00155549AD|nr:urea ABC transporter permease subunit UrtB [Niveibacterium sp. COAC-50]